MNPACPRRVSLITAHGLPAIPSPTICELSGTVPAVTGLTRRYRLRLSLTGSPNLADRIEFTCLSSSRLVMDWSFSPRCSPPRIAATQLRFDTARLFTAQKRTPTVLSTRPLRRTSADILVCRSADFPVGPAPPRKRTSESSRRPAGRNARETADRNVCATPDGLPMGKSAKPQVGKFAMRPPRTPAVGRFTFYFSTFHHFFRGHTGEAVQQRTLPPF
jgi:hypothetical protein